MTSLVETSKTLIFIMLTVEDDFPKGNHHKRVILSRDFSCMNPANLSKSIHNVGGTFCLAYAIRLIGEILKYLDLMVSELKLINKPNNKLIKTIFYTGLALIAFASNSVLCRLALGERVIDAASFTIIRLLSGVIVLLLLNGILRNKNTTVTKGSWSSGLMLFIYAITFSYAYITLDTGTGALILFASVQITMVLVSLISGNRLRVCEYTGVIIAFTGFVYLILPGVSTPSAIGFLMMSVSGIAWGIYTLKGIGLSNPLMTTTYNFIRTIPFVLILIVITNKNASYSSEGILLAVLSGGIASGIGYTIWYIALGGLSSIQAAVLQLLVPVIATMGGVVFVSEAITLRLTVSAIMILGGIFLSIWPWSSSRSS
jgi:drug/metabolite transporter (DMT)-like permease